MSTTKTCDRLRGRLGEAGSLADRPRTRVLFDTMKYFHRTSVSPDQVMERAATFFGARLTPAAEGPRHRQFAGPMGQVTVTVEAEGGHYTLIVVETNQVGESEADKLAKSFLTAVHTLAEPNHTTRGSY